MPTSPHLLFSALHLARPLDIADVRSFLDRLAADRVAPRVVLEARADADGVRYLLGCRTTELHAVRRVLTDFLPGSSLLAVDQQDVRPAVGRAVRLRANPRSMPLAVDAAELTTRALLSALSAVSRVQEAAVVQLILGPRHAPRLLPAEVTAPDLSLFDALTVGSRPATRDARARLQERLAHNRFAATIRLGAASKDPEREQRFVLSLLSAISTAQAPGVHLHLVAQPAAALNEARLPLYWPLRLTAPELVGLLAWPIGDAELPGVPSMHPKPLRAAITVHTGPRVFAESAVPGDKRQLGIASADLNYHTVSYGPSGSGKTTVALRLICADIEAGHAVAVLDPKRQLIEDVLSIVPQHRIDDVVVIDASEDRPVAFNPLDVAGRDPDVVVDGILAVFKAAFHDGWGARTEDIFSATLRTLGRASTPDRPATLLDIPTLLTDANFRRQQVGRVRHDVGLAGFWAWYDSQSPAAQAAAVASPLNKLRQLLLRPALVRILDQRERAFRLRDLFRERKIVLVPLNEGLIGPGTAGLLGSLIIADIWQAAQERAGEPDAAQHPGVVYVDEAPRFLNLPVSLADALAVSRSLSVGWFLAAQFRNQFPPALRQAVDFNARSKIQFATEFEDARDTARLTHDLTAEDFIALPKYHAYVNLVAGGHPSGWALVRTLPPPAPITDPAAVRSAARAKYAPSEPRKAPPTDTQPTNPPDTQPAPAAPPDADRIGRKRRRP